MANYEVGALINQSPRPRLLVKGFAEQDELVQQLLELAPTSRKINWLHEVRQEEWDVIISDEGLGDEGEGYRLPTPLSPHIFAIYVGSILNGFYNKVENSPQWRGLIAARCNHICQELQRVRGLPDGVSALVHEEFEPNALARESHGYFFREAATSSGPSASNRPLVPDLEPFLLTGDGKILAGRYQRSAIAEAWVLPQDCGNVTRWAKVALTQWHSKSPDRFPAMPGWTESESWMTPLELDIKSQLIQLGHERDKTLKELSDRETQLRVNFREAQEAADTYERSLLTLQGSELVKAVIQALHEIGFNVRDMDVDATPDDHLEDLRVEDSDAPNWIALVEVKGYTKGAKTEALAQFVRFNQRYMLETGSIPNACWYVVNQFAKRDPATRQPALHGKDDDVAAFAQAGGLVIDTVSLFQLLMQVRAGAVSKEDARSNLRGATGRYAV